MTTFTLHLDIICFDNAQYIPSWLLIHVGCLLLVITVLIIHHIYHNNCDYSYIRSVHFDPKNPSWHPVSQLPLTWSHDMGSAQCSLQTSLHIRPYNPGSHSVKVQKKCIIYWLIFTRCFHEKLKNWWKSTIQYF